MFEDSAWTQGELGHFSIYQICRMLLPHEEKRGRVCWFWSTLCPWCQRGRVTWCLNEEKEWCQKWGMWNGVIVFLMYLSVVVTKHHRGCHQVQRGRFLAIWCRMFSLNGNPLDEEDGNLLDEVVLDRICLDELNMMYLQCVQKAMEKGTQHVLILWWKRVCL